MEGIVFSGAERDSLEEKQEGPEIDISNHLEQRPKRGRPYSLSEEKIDQLLNLYYTTSYSLRRIADILGVSRISRSTIRPRDARDRCDDRGMTVWRAVKDAYMMNITN